MSFYVVLPIFLVLLLLDRLSGNQPSNHGKRKSNDWADLCGRTAFNRVAYCRLDQDIRGKKHGNRKFRCGRMAK